METITVLSLGAGVQSTTVLLLAEHGAVPRPIEAIFADTGWEPDYVYTHLDWLRTQTSIPIHVVTAGNLREDALASKTSAWMPMYVKRLDGHEGMLRRQCTSNYKIDPIRRRLRVLMKEHGVKRVRQQQGISFDEAVKRMRVSDVQYIENAYPLVDLRMDRQACKRWLSEHGYPIPGKSACIGCPYHDRATWREMRANRPADFANACDFEDGLREKGGSAIGDAFLTRAFIPLRDVDLSSAEDRGQLSFGDGFGDECFGMCGV